MKRVIVVGGIVPGEASAPPDLEGLREQLRELVSAFKVPRRLFLLTPEEIPFTDSGKLHPGRLRELLAAKVAPR